MSALLDQLKRNQRRGSKPRCHLLTHGTSDAVAARLTALAAPFATVNPTDRWMPQGFDHTGEATLPEAERLLPAEVRRELKQWWLAVTATNTRTPCWDMASTCTIVGKPGMLLIEAKAHNKELLIEQAGKKFSASSASANSLCNHIQIGHAISTASAALAAGTGLPWALSRDAHYQMSNRFAWAWKLADLGIPVVLIYLGFLNAHEMSDQGNPFPDAVGWQHVLIDHSQPLFPAEVWNQPWTCAGQPVIPLIRSIEMPLSSEAIP